MGNMGANTNAIIIPNANTSIRSCLDSELENSE